MMTMLSLELDTPQICRGVSLRLVEGTKLVAEVRSSSSNATGTSCRPIRISLPSSVDVTKILQPCSTDHGDAGGGKASRLGEALSVEILGYDGDVTFSIGTAVIEIPQDLRSSFDQSGGRSSAFCTVVEDCSGSGTGTLSGTFLSRQKGDAKLTLLKTQEKAIGSSASARGKMYCDPTFQDPLDKEDSDTDHSGDLSRKAIDILEEASNILNSSPLALRQGPQIVSRYDDVLTGMGPTVTEEKEAQNDSTLTQGAASSVQVMHQSTSPSVPMNASTNVPTCPKVDDQEPAIRVPTAGFRFEPTTGSVNWQRVAVVNVSKIEREGNLQAVKRFIPEVAVGRVNSDYVDANPGLLNAFRLSQLQVQYVLHCQQILQGQCDGLQSAVSNMKLEVEKNTRGNKAMKDRVGLLRRESREQDKIINSYSAILRAQNPELAAKVRLDGKGRLRVFNVDEATRDWERRSHRRRHRRGRRDGSRVPNLRRRQPETEDISNEGKTTTNEAHPERFTPLSGRRDVDLNQISPKALTTAWTMGTLEAERGRINASSSTAEGPRSLREGSKMEAEETFAFGDDRYVHRSRSETADAVRGFYPRGDSVTESGESETDVRERRGLSNQYDSGDGKTSVAREIGVETSSEGGNKQAASPPGIGGSNAELLNDGVARTPRLVTVQVKPRRPTGETLTSPKLAEGNASACLQDEADANVLCPGSFVASSGAGLSGVGQLPVMEATPNPKNARPASSRIDRISVSLGKGNWEGSRDDNSSGDGMKSAAAKVEGNERVSPSPAKTASHLGLEEEGLPNSVDEFDLDDISEIDVGGEWVATGGGKVDGSISS